MRLRAILLYQFIGLVIAAAVLFQTGITAASCVLGTSCLSVICAGAIKHALLWSDTAQKVFTPAIAMTLLVLVYSFLAPQFSISMFGYVIGGTIWEIVGVVVGLVFVTPEILP